MFNLGRLTVNLQQSCSCPKADTRILIILWEADLHKSAVEGEACIARVILIYVYTADAFSIKRKQGACYKTVISLHKAPYRTRYIRRAEILYTSASSQSNPSRNHCRGAILITLNQKQYLGLYRSQDLLARRLSKLLD